MKGNYEEDKFTENEVLACLESAGLHFRNGSRYILSQCPTHEDAHPSVQIYKDDWFVNCHAGCGRFHITKAFPSLRETQEGWQSSGVQSSGRKGFSRSNQPGKTSKDSQGKVMAEYKSIDLMEMWKGMEEIPEDHEFKTIPIDVLNSLGWRYDRENERYFIPYFDRSQKFIPFGQWRNLKSGPRFNFWKDAKPLIYGLWNLDPSNSPLFLVEGCSDAAVMDYCAVPWVAAPSAASGELLRAMAGWCTKNGIELVYGGDNDSAGDKLKDILDETCSYRLRQPPEKYKDWGDFLVAEGVEAVQDYCFKELFPPEIKLPEPKPREEMSDLEKVQEVFPGSKQLEIVGLPEESKEQSMGRRTVLF